MWLWIVVATTVLAGGAAYVLTRSLRRRLAVLQAEISELTSHAAAFPAEVGRLDARRLAALRHPGGDTTNA
ncbi:MAG: hypothetical protein WAZ15_03280 [Propioniciclava sp.]|jgi:hypothetical protein